MSKKWPRILRNTFLPFAVILLFLIINTKTAMAATSAFMKTTDIKMNDPESVQTADLNGDGYDDLLVTNQGNYDGTNNFIAALAVCISNGDGTFAPPVYYPLGNYWSALKQFAVTDINQDGKLDVAIASQNSNQIAVLIGNGDGTLSVGESYPAGASPEAVSAGDFNNDGIVDLAVACFDTNTLSILFGNSGGFASPVLYHTGYASNSLTAGDFNNDTFLDLAVSNYSDGNISVLLNDGSGSFMAPLNYEVPANSKIVSCDFNNDSRLDLAVGGMDGTYLLLGNGNGTFGNAVPYGNCKNNKSIAAADFDFDNKIDLISLNNEDVNNTNGRPGLTIMDGNGDGTFQPPTNMFITPQGTYEQFSEGTLASGDFNNDGKPDFAVVHYDTLNTVSVYMNYTGAPNVHNLTVSANPVSGGNVIGTGAYVTGDTVTVTAKPNSGYVFDNWTIGGTPVSSSAAYTFTMGASDCLLAANFVPQHEVNLLTNPYGWGSQSGAGTYKEGAQVTVSAYPNEGYYFTGWTDSNGNVVSTSQIYTFTMGTSNCLLYANYGIIQYAVNVSANPAAGGSVEGGGWYPDKALVTVTASPNAGYNFVNWTQDGTQVSTDTSYSFTMGTSEINLAANFALIPVPHTVTVLANPTAGGTVIGGGSYSQGTPVTLTAAAKTGYAFINWTNGGTAVSNSPTYTFTMGNANCTYTANFQAVTWPKEVRLSTKNITASSVTLYLNQRVPNAEKYTIKCSNGITYTFDGNLTEFVISGLSPGNTYTFTIQAVLPGNLETTNGPSKKIKLLRK